ncbi:MAG: hypothetical protein ABI852_10305 [Gemmatimonadaceae bacterium]
MNVVTRSTVALAAFLIAPVVAAAQATPSADEVFARYVNAIGGVDAVMHVSSIKSTGKVDLPGTGISGTFESFAAPHRIVTKMNIAGVGEIANGYDGSVAWEVNPMQGPRIKSEKEKISAQEEADFYASILFLKERFQSAETVGPADFGGEKTWQIKTVLKSGKVVNEFFSVATGLKVGSQSTSTTDASSTNIVTVESEYKQFGALKRATRSEMTTGARKVVVTLTDVQLGELPETAFALPEPVKALIKQY